MGKGQRLHGRGFERGVAPEQGPEFLEIAVPERRVSLGDRLCLRIPETRGDTAQAQSHRWLSARGFELPSVYVVHGSRGKIAASLNLDVLVDDRPENCLDIAIDSSARAILVWRSPEDAVPGSARQLGIGSVGSIAECLDILESLDRGDQGTGIVDRFKQLLGLKRAPRRASVQVQATAPQ